MAGDILNPCRGRLCPGVWVGTVFTRFAVIWLRSRGVADKMAGGVAIMKALVKETKGKSYVYKDVPVPEPGPGELLVKPIKVGLCGSDIHFYDWTSGKQ